MGGSGFFWGGVMRVFLLAMVLFVGLGLAGCGRPYELRGTPYEPVLAAPEIGGIQKDGTPFQIDDVPQKVKLVFFGYTFCPDVCPLTLTNIRSVFEKLTPEQRTEVAAILVSVDPERDSPERLKTYVEAFDPTFQGVHVPMEQLPAVKKSYGVYAEKRFLEDQESSADYFIDHSAFVYVIDKDNQLREIFPTDAPPTDIAADVQHLLGE